MARFPFLPKTCCPLLARSGDSDTSKLAHPTRGVGRPRSGGRGRPVQAAGQKNKGAFRIVRAPLLIRPDKHALGRLPVFIISDALLRFMGVLLPAVSLLWCFTLPRLRAGYNFIYPDIYPSANGICYILLYVRHPGSTGGWHEAVCPHLNSMFLRSFWL